MMRDNANLGGSVSPEDVRRTLQVGRRSEWRVARWFVMVAIITVVGLGVATMLRLRASTNEPQYTTERVRRADLDVTVSATGKLHGLNTVQVGAEVTGKVLRVLVDYNDSVKKGQVLAEIDPEQLNASVEEARAQVLTAGAGIRTAKATLTETKLARARAEEQASQGLISQKDLESSRAAAARAEASLASAKASASLSAASHKSAASRLRKTKIVAPIDGIVLARSIEPGQTVTAGFQTPILFRLAEDLTKLELHVDVDEADIGRVVEGATATFTVDAYPQRSFRSIVRSLRNEPKTSQNVVTYEAVLTVDNDERLLRPGMTATATITSQKLKDVLVVPNAALRFAPAPIPGVPLAPQTTTTADEKRVFILRDGAPQHVAVRVGASDGHVTEITGELNAGDEVIIDAALPL